MSGNILHDIAKGGDKHNAITYLETSLIQFIRFKNTQGRTWHISEQFQTTSATVKNTAVYVGDVVQYTSREHGISYGKVQTFFVKVLIELSQDDIR